jgi:hypothetical protein
MSVALANLTTAVTALIAKVQSTAGLQAQIDALTVQVTDLQNRFNAEQVAEEALADQANAALST